jgi:hypothetical protein
MLDTRRASITEAALELKQIGVGEHSREPCKS